MTHGRRIILVSLASTLLLCATGSAQIFQTLSQEDKEMAIDGILDAIENNYVFPDKALAMVDEVRGRQDAGEYDAISGGPVLARALTDHMMAICQDKHFGIRFHDEPVAQSANHDSPDPERLAQRREQGRWNHHGFREVRRMAGNVGYVKFNSFTDPELGRDTASAAMDFLAGCDSIIVDLRENGGGSPGMVAWITSYLYGDEPVHLNSLYFRPADSTEEFWTDPDVPGRKSPDADVYVLTSNYTFSAAEEFTYNLQSQKRATIVGEVTGGGAHPVDSFFVEGRFQVRVPVGRAINPITGTNWEGVGIRPEVEVPANEALLNAHILALEKALEKYPQPDRQQELRKAMAQANGELADVELSNEERTGGG